MLCAELNKPTNHSGVHGSQGWDIGQACCKLVTLCLPSLITNHSPSSVRDKEPDWRSIKPRLYLCIVPCNIDGERGRPPWMKLWNLLSSVKLVPCISLLCNCHIIVLMYVCVDRDYDGSLFLRGWGKLTGGTLMCITVAVNEIAVHGLS